MRQVSLAILPACRVGAGFIKSGMGKTPYGIRALLRLSYHGVVMHPLEATSYLVPVGASADSQLRSGEVPQGGAAVSNRAARHAVLQPQIHHLPALG